MSNWSSFEKDKIATDAWRSFLNENTFRPIGEEYRVKGIAPALKGGIGPVRTQKPDAEEEDAEEEEEEWEREETEEIEVEDPEDEAEDTGAPADLPGASEFPYDPPYDDPGGEEDDEDAEEETLPGHLEDEELADAKDAKLKERIKNVFGGAMDVATLASFFPGVGQAIAGAATAASLLNNLTYEQPRYGWAALDLAAIALSAIPAGAAAAKSPKIARALVNFGARATKLEKGADALRVVGGYTTLEQELDAELGSDIAKYVKKGLTEKAADGKYYVNELLDTLKFKLDPDTAGYKRASELEEKIKELQDGPTSISEAQIKHWQVLAGIKKSVI